VPSVTVIVNERAGSATPDGAAALEREFARQGLQARLEVVSTGDAISKSATLAAARGDILVAAGGDGTVSGVAAVAVNTGAVLGVVPLGTLNHFARDAGIPLDREKAIAAIAAGRIETLDAAEVNGRTFVNNASLGLYPRMVWERTCEQRAGRRKWTAFALAAVRTWRSYRTMTVRIAIDEQEYLRHTPFLFVGNGAYQATGLGLGGRESLRHGQLSVYVAPECGRFDLLALPLRALAHRLNGDRFESFCTQELTVALSRPRVSVALDGEIEMMAPPLRSRVRPRVLRTIVGPEAEPR
jgi:diacylglycerol kinase family enzyme